MKFHHFWPSLEKSFHPPTPGKNLSDAHGCRAAKPDRIHFSHQPLLRGVHSLLHDAQRFNQLRQLVKPDANFIAAAIPKVR